MPVHPIPLSSVREGPEAHLNGVSSRPVPRTTPRWTQRSWGARNRYHEFQEKQTSPRSGDAQCDAPRPVSPRYETTPAAPGSVPLSQQNRLCSMQRAVRS